MTYGVLAMCLLESTLKLFPAFQGGAHKPISLMRKVMLIELFNLLKGRVGIQLNSIDSRACIPSSTSCFPHLQIHHWKVK